MADPVASPDLGQGPACALVVDIGSSSVRATVVGLAARPRAVCTARKAWSVLDDAGTADPEAVCSGATEVALAALSEAGLMGGRKPDSAGGAAPVADSETQGRPRLGWVLVTGFVTAMVLLDGSGSPVGRAMTYAASGPDDGDASVKDRVPAALWAETGTPFLHQSYLGPQLRARLAGTAAAVAVASLGSLVVSRWIGCPASDVGCSLSEAAWTGLWDWRRECWSSAALAACGIEAGTGGIRMPRVAVGASPWARAPGAGGGGAARVTEGSPLAGPGTVGALVALSVADGAAAAWGSGCAVSGGGGGGGGGAMSGGGGGGGLTPGWVGGGPLSLTVGTSAAARAVLPRAALASALASDPRLLRDAGLWAYAVTPSEVLVGGALTDGASVGAWCDGVLAPGGAGRGPAAEAPSGPPGPSGPSGPSGHTEPSGPPGAGDGTAAEQRAPCLPSDVAVLPFLRGERATGWDGARRLVVSGAGASTSPAELRRAVVQGVAMRLGSVVAALLEVRGKCGCGGEGGSAEAVAVASGGALESQGSEWPGLVAACAGLPLHIGRGGGGEDEDAATRGGGLEATTLGALVLAALAAEEEAAEEEEAGEEEGGRGDGGGLARHAGTLVREAGRQAERPAAVVRPPPAGSPAAEAFRRARERHDALYAATTRTR